MRFVGEVNPAVPGWEAIPDDQLLTFVPLEAVWPGRMDYSRQRPKARVASGYTRFCEGDVIVPKITPTFQADRSTLIRGMPTAVGTGSTELHVMRPSAMIDARYLDYLVSSRPFLLGGEAWMIGVAGQKRVPDQWIRDFPVPVTDPTDQRAIADYLDSETSRIDALITKKRRMIQLLQERWRAKTESVLSRFTPLPLKRYTTKIGSGSTPRGGADVYVTTGAVFLRSQNITNGVVDFSDVVFIDRLAQDQLRRALVRPGDVLLNITGGSIGRAAVMDRSDIRAYVSQHVCIVRPAPGVDARVLWAELSSQSVQEQIAVTQVGGNREGLNFEQVGNLLVRVPPTEQSQAIAQELATAFGSVGRATETLRMQIELLNERRQALITAAVAGALPQ